MGDVAPWYRVRRFDNALRRIFYNPARMFGPYVKPGMTVLDVGCGAGFNCLGLARLVGETGRVVAVDVQQELLDILKARAQKARLSERIRTHKCEGDDIGIREEFDFVNAFWMVHETPDAARFFCQVVLCLKPEARFFVAEPKFHTSREVFHAMVEAAQKTGLQVVDKPGVRFSRAVVFRKK
jgi:ubiquinone/menaquinone biosynthesis C-methylase UbiE